MSAGVNKLDACLSIKGCSRCSALNAMGAEANTIIVSFPHMEEERSIELLPGSHPWLQSVSNLIFLALAYEGRSP